MVSSARLRTQITEWIHWLVHGYNVSVILIVTPCSFFPMAAIITTRFFPLDCWLDCRRCGLDIFLERSGVEVYARALIPENYRVCWGPLQTIGSSPYIRGDHRHT